MSFKTVLVVTTPESSDADVVNAAEFCRRIQAHLSILVVAFAAPPPIGEYAAMVSEAWLEQRQEDARRLMARQTSMQQLLARQDLSGDVSIEYPEAAYADEAIGRRARYADVTYVGHEILANARLKSKIVEGALFASGRPVLIVPEGMEASPMPRKIVVGWDARVEAARAIREALDLIKGADEIRLVLVDPMESETAHGAEPGADAAAYLARHGIKVFVDRLPLEGHSVAQVLSRHAGDVGAELIVMGGYGHSRLRERIFGGVTRAMIDAPHIPVLLAR
jgi:nucleotide-binding universal stress UspA family protein